MAATEVLPAGNEWEFSERNVDPAFIRVTPGPKITETLQPVGPLQQIVQEVHSRFIKEGWQFTSLIIDLRFTETDGISSLAVVFTHPLRTALVSAEKVMDLDFIKSGDTVTVGVGPIQPSDSINQILRGTNWIVSQTRAAYNLISVEERLFKQIGVGIFAIDIWPVERRISYLDGRINELMEKLVPLQKEREAFLILQSPNPVPLFQTR